MTDQVAAAALLSAKDVSFSYHPGTEVLGGVDFELRPGEMTALAGPNGSGKSTLLKLLAGLLEPDRGAVCLGGRSLGEVSRRELARAVAVVPQETRLSLPFTVGEMVLMGRSPYVGYWGIESDADVAAARRAMEFTDLWDLRDRLVWDLSGGEKQRAVIARALAQEPTALLLDEPTTFLDLRHQVEIYELIRRLNADSGLTVLIVGHDLNMSARYCSRIVMLAGGGIVKDGAPTEVLTPETVQDVFGIAVRVETLADGTGLVVHEPPPGEAAGGGKDR